MKIISSLKEEMALTIALPDGIHHKSVVETVPYSVLRREEAKYLISGTIVDSRLKGYCEITVIAPSAFYKVIGFFNDGRWDGNFFYDVPYQKVYEVVNSNSTLSHYVHQNKRELQITMNNVKTVFEWRHGTNYITKKITSDNQTTTTTFQGDFNWFDAIIDASDWIFLKNRSIIGKTERVPEDPFYVSERRHLPFQAPNSASTENAPAGIQ